MEKLLYFDFCAIPILLVILITVFVRKMTGGKSNRLFIALILMAVVAALSDLIMEYACRAPYPLSEASMIIADLAAFVYFLSRTSLITVYFFFLYAITGTWYRIRSKSLKAALLLPQAIVVILVLSNPFTHGVYEITADGGYQRGPLIYILYAISTIYAFTGMIHLLSCRRFLSPGKTVSLCSLYLLSMTSVVLQYFFPFLLIEMITTAFSVILVILFVLRPEEISDASVGSLSFEAYKSEIKKILLTKQTVNIAVINFTNAEDLRAYLGEENYFNYVTHVIRQLDLMFIRERVNFGIYFEHPGTVYIIIDDPAYDIENAYLRLGEELRRRSDKAAESGERIIDKVCCITVPDDISDFSGIIRFGREFSLYMPPNVEFAKAADIVKSNDYKIISNIDTILSRAIDENKFRMYYQPIYSLEEERFVSAEALIRLNDEEYGFVSPALFIPAAEKRGVILPIGDFVLEDVHRFISENDFDELGLHYIEINLSVAQCMQEELPEKFAFLCDKYGVPSNRLNLEITETTYEDMGRVMEFNLEALTGMGYTFSLDDYGTGYSNMQRVSKLPLKIIKLDKSLIDDMESEEGESIVRNTIKMMRDIDKELVAEGVESKESLDVLKSMGCHFIQGFYFSKPLPEDEFIEFICRHNKVKQG